MIGDEKFKELNEDWIREWFRMRLWLKIKR